MNVLMSRMFRELLQLDKPVQRLSAAEAEAAQERDFRWNLITNSLDIIFFTVSISLLSATTILPLFISKLTNSTIPLAIVAMVAQGGHFLPQLFVANFVERIDHKKSIVVNLGFVTERIPAILLLLAPLAAYWSTSTALILFLIFYSWFTIGGGVISIAWQELIARCFPVKTRGRVFGVNSFIGTLLGVGAASVAGIILDRVAFPLNFVYIFGAVGITIFLSWVFIALVREPVEATDVPRRSNREYLVQLPVVVREDTNFRNFLIARFTLAIAEMGTGFLTVAAIHTWTVSDSMVATFTTVTLLGQTTGGLIGGFVADRYGHRITLEFSALTGTVAFGLAWLSPAPFWFIVVFALMGFFQGMRIVSSILVVLEFCGPEKRPTYIGLANTLTGVGSVIAPILGAGLVQVGYHWAFVASMLTGLVSLLMLRFWVKEPREG
ncbi:MAG: MFS transporter [Chloroflexota bacterium]